ncbi:hypothetical protein AOR02nite_09440 [Acetobacter orientalis]|nr:hypothetical protein Abor_010_091 [Acetobacter orientalis]GEL61102.1 hypothetical protein AOR02nite_09440 [Acetobacter orientalis]
MQGVGQCFIDTISYLTDCPHGQPVQVYPGSAWALMLQKHGCTKDGPLKQGAAVIY